MASPKLDIWIYRDLPKNQRQARKNKTLTNNRTMTTTYTNAKNWLVQAELLAKSGLTDLIAGKDSGAGYGKAIIGDFSIMMPAVYSLVRNRNIMHHETISKDGAWVRYVEGCDSLLSESR